MIVYSVHMHTSFRRELASVLLKAVAVVLTFAFILALIDAWYNTTAISDGSCNIAVLPVEGAILPFASYGEFSLITTPTLVRNFLADVAEDPFIDGILFEINSPGGTPVAAEQISEMITDLTIPNISLIGDMGASGAYLVAASADKILASAMSDVGSIGVTMSYVENSKQNEEEGLTFVELASGKFKDAGNPNKALTEEERARFQKDIEVVHNEFVSQVALLRGKSIDEIKALADGSAMPGARALEVGLIDGIGGRREARAEFAKLLNTNEEEIIFCEYAAPMVFF